LRTEFFTVRLRGKKTLVSFTPSAHKPLAIPRSDVLHCRHGPDAPLPQAQLRHAPQATAPGLAGQGGEWNRPGATPGEPDSGLGRP
jgi:hypothetical protein